MLNCRERPRNVSQGGNEGKICAPEKMITQTCGNIYLAADF